LFFGFDVGIIITVIVTSRGQQDISIFRHIVRGWWFSGSDVHHPVRTFVIAQKKPS
jgi:hypothetical protein